MKFPFDETDLEGKHVVISEKMEGTPSYTSLFGIELSPSGRALPGREWSVGDDNLTILDEDGTLQYEFKGVESRSGIVYAVGPDRLGTNLNLRYTLHEKKTLQPEDWKVCISSHVKYSEHTLPPLLRSLKGAGVPNDRIVVAIGGAEDSDVSTYEEDGITYRVTTQEKWGFVALDSVRHFESEYWFLLHDTCTVEEDFVSRVQGIDVGLKPDVVLYSTDSEIGLYSDEFLDNNTELLDVILDDLMKNVVSRARVLSLESGRIVEETPRDIYGTGNRRKTLKMIGFGVNKYLAPKTVNKKP